MQNKLEAKLNNRKAEGTYRSLMQQYDLIDFASNDYLGFSKIKTISDHSDFGSTGSRLISGNSLQAVECEDFLSHFFDSESALVFNSGYDANLGFFSSIPQKGDLIIYDSDIHASVRDGVRLSLAKSHSFAHNSAVDLEKKLQLVGDIKYVVIESLYSMSGEMAPIVPLLEVCERYNAKLIVDEAHAAGIFGEKGKGICHALGIHKRIFARIITFGKAYGSHGAAVVADRLVKDFLINFARSFIYTTALPPEQYQRISTLVNHTDLLVERNKLIENITLFRSLLPLKYTSISEVNSPIQFILLDNVQQAVELSELFKNRGMFVKAVVSPTVAKGKEGIRVCLHSFNEEHEIQKLVDCMKGF